MWSPPLPFPLPLSPALCQHLRCLSSTSASLSTIIDSIFFIINPLRTFSPFDILFILIVSRVFDVLIGVLSRAYKGLPSRTLSAEPRKLEQGPISRAEKGKGIYTRICVYAWAEVAGVFRQIRRVDMMGAFYLAHWLVLWLHVTLCAGRQDVFQLYQPVFPVDEGSVGCSEDVLLMDHVFSSSYGKPFVGSYEPPSCEFDTVRMNLTVTSEGRQFDRLALMYLGDTEVFRTSTAEPTADGIVWTYIKDMSPYNALWKEPQKLIFDLGNQITDVYTGPFSATLTATFSHGGNVKTADVIIPISARKSNSDSPSAFTVPSDNTTVQYKIPSSASRAVVSISACGQSTEEFWWSNVFSSDTETFNSTIGGYSPFREVQLYIDGVLAGVVWPFPIIFTGGVTPGFWRPIVGIDAFDLRQPELDISPFIPLLTDGQDHSFEIKVAGLDLSSDGTATLSNSVGSNWVVTGNIFLYLEDGNPPSSFIATRNFNRMPIVDAAAPKISVSRNLNQNSAKQNESLSYSVLVERTLTVNSSDVSWSQKLSYSNHNLLNQQGLAQITHQSTSGVNIATQNGQSNNVSFEYPLSVITITHSAADEFTIDAQMKRGLTIEATNVTGISTYTLNAGPAFLRTKQWGNAHYISKADGNSTSFGDTTNTFESQAGGRSYGRNVRAVNGSIAYDAPGISLSKAHIVL